MSLPIPLLGGSQTDTSEASRLLAGAERLRQEGEFEKGIQLLRKALELNQRSTEIWSQIGTLYLESGDLLEARNAFRRALSLQETDGDTWVSLGRAEFGLREYERALQSFTRARAVSIRDPENELTARYHQGILLSRFQEFDGSFLILFDLAYHHPSDSEVSFALGIASLRLPFLPVEVPHDRREAVDLAGKVMGNLADFRLDEARELYRELSQQFMEFPNIQYADPDLLLTISSDTGFPVNSRPEVITAEAANLPDEDLVIGIEINGRARAYPVNYMNGPMNEAVNDVLGEVPILASW